MGVSKLRSPSRRRPTRFPVEGIERRILAIRGQQVLLDSHLAELYGVATKHLNQQVRRNRKRFPPDFLFHLTRAEAEALRSQFVTSNAGRGGRRYIPMVFTEQGVAMLSSVLHSDRAIDVNIAIMRAFVRMRELFLGQRDLARRMEEMADRYDAQFVVVFDALERLKPPPKPPRRIGFAPAAAAPAVMPRGA